MCIRDRLGVTRLFIVNLLSERVVKTGSILQPLVGDMNAELLILDRFDALPSAVTQAANDKIDHVIIEGGDGTVQGVISAFLNQAEAFNTFPAFSIVPGGMTNQVAKNIGLKVKTANAVKSALERDLNPFKIPLLNIIDSDAVSYTHLTLPTICSV